MLSLAFDGNRFRGEILPELERLKREGLLRIIDLLFVRKDSMGGVMVTRSSDLDWGEAVSLGLYFGALAGLIGGGAEGMERGAIAGAAELADGHYFDEDDVFRVTQSLPDNCRPRWSCWSTSGRSRSGLPSTAPTGSSSGTTGSGPS